MCFEMIPAKEIDKYINQCNVIIIDLREKEDYENGHVISAVNMPYDEFMECFKKLSKCSIYILYCDRGSSSLLAARDMSKFGYQVINVVGGINAYRGTLEKNTQKINIMYMWID